MSSRKIPVTPSTRTTTEALLDGVPTRERALDLRALAHDASHYLLIPKIVHEARSTADVESVFGAYRSTDHSVTFRSGGTSLSGQGVTDQVLLDTRKHFRGLTVHGDGSTVTAQPGVTVRQVNARLAPYGRKLGPDPASEIACTVGGVVANNSSGMACGTHSNTYATLDSMVVTLPSGTTIDTAVADADELLRRSEPQLYSGLAVLRERLLAVPQLVDEVRRQFSMKNTMGYGINALLDFERPIDILSHLMIGSEGTLGFVSEATFRTVAIKPAIATGLLVFHSLSDAAAALPSLVAADLATVELMDARSLRVAQTLPDVPEQIRNLVIEDQAALLVELQAETDDILQLATVILARLVSGLALAAPFALTRDSVARSSLWHVRKGLYTTLAGSRAPGTTALLEDIAVPVPEILATCRDLSALFERHGYTDAVIFGHAKDGNLHFMISERFGDDPALARYEHFTEDLVDVVLGHGGTLKAEHGTGRIMAPFVARQYGPELYEIMREIKRLCDPTQLLNPGIVLTQDPRAYLQNLKASVVVEAEVDRCVECGYCEPSCPSKDLTLTPRQRIVLRRELAEAEANGDATLVAELRREYEYDGIQTCAVDGMCASACPVGINTGDLVRRLRAERGSGPLRTAWNATAEHWGAISSAGSLALSAAHAMPSPLVTAATNAARAVLGSENVPRYSGELPVGGRRRSKVSAEPTASKRQREVVFFSACIGAMFGEEGHGRGASQAFLELCRRAGIDVKVPDGIDGLCCGTPWKSKGHLRGYESMTERVLPALREASEGARLPIVCDAASCSEGLLGMVTGDTSAQGQQLRVVDAVAFAHEVILPRLKIARRLRSVAVHPTCSTTALAENTALAGLASAVAEEVVIPQEWGCCAFAGDRGLLHPELTASATTREAAELEGRTFDAYVSANRTCELGMTRATGHEYRHILEVLEEATRG